MARFRLRLCPRRSARYPSRADPRRCGHAWSCGAHRGRSYRGGREKRWCPRPPFCWVPCLRDLWAPSRCVGVVPVRLGWWGVSEVGRVFRSVGVAAPRCLFPGFGVRRVARPWSPRSPASSAPRRACFVFREAARGQGRVCPVGASADLRPMRLPLLLGSFVVVVGTRGRRVPR